MRANRRRDDRKIGVRFTRASGDPEHSDRRFQVTRLLVQRARRGGRLLHQRGVLLRHFIHLDDRLIHLLNARTLFKR